MTIPCAALLMLCVIAGPPDAPLTEAAAIQAGLAANPALRAARFGQRAAQARTDRDKPVARPVVTAQAVGTLQGPRVTFPRAGDDDATVLPERFARVELALEQPLYRPGLGAARRRYAAESRANAWEYLQAQNDTTRDIRRAFYAALAARTMSDVARQGAELARRHLDLARLMLQAGTASERDVRASEAGLAEAEQGARKAAAGVEMADADLNRLLGREPDAPVALADAAAPPEVPADPAQGIALALTRRPEVQRLEESLAAARAGVSLARSQQGPALSARATAAQQTPSAFVDQSYLAASLVLTWNPFDAGRARADSDEARAQVGRLEALLEEARLGVKTEVLKGLADMRLARAGIDAADRQVAAAQAALDISELRFQARSASQVEVASALFGLAKARANRLQADHDLRAAAADYAHATGVDVPPPGRPGHEARLP